MTATNETGTAVDTSGTEDVDQVVAAARRGNVVIPPAKAIAMAGMLFGQGKLDQAEAVCRQIIKARPSLPDAHNILGVTLNAQGKTNEAVSSLKKAIALAPSIASFHANLGEILRQAGQMVEAESALQAALVLEPGNAQALNNLGIINFDRKDYARAVEFYRKALESKPNMAEAFNNLGNALRMTDNSAEAIQAYQDALTVREVYPEAYNNLGTLLQGEGRLEEAERALKKAIIQKPQYVEAHNNLAQFYAAQGRDVDALGILGGVLKFASNNVQTLLITARIQNRRANFMLAEQGARAALNLEPDNIEALVLLGQVLHETDQYDQALAVLEKAVALAPEHAEALNFYGVTLKSVGRLDEAREQILKSIEFNDSLCGAYANLNDLVDFSEGIGEKLFEQMDAIFATATDIRAPHLLPLHFAYAKALEDRGEHSRALEHYIIGGKMKRAELNYDEAETFAFFDQIMAVFTPELFKRFAHQGDTGEQLVFIVGMPRSGSTLVEQILASHPDVHGAGEVKHLSRVLGQLRDRFPSLHKYPQMIDQISSAHIEIIAKNYLNYIKEECDNARKITDKLLTNYFFLGVIHILFPRAKIVHTIRNPIDTCLSGFTKLFKDDMPHSYDLSELGRYYGMYRKLMAHWQQVLPPDVILEVSYEKMVSDTESEAKRLIDFVGLEWSPACLEFYKSDRPVKTASVAQVRRPIYKSAVDRWKRYGDELQPLIEALDAA